MISSVPREAWRNGNLSDLLALGAVAAIALVGPVSVAQAQFAYFGFQPDRWGAGSEELGARILHQWASLGAYDFVNVVEAPDDLTMANLSVKLGARGSVKFETLTLLPVDELLAALEK